MSQGATLKITGNSAIQKARETVAAKFNKVTLKSSGTVKVSRSDSGTNSTFIIKSR